MFIIRFMQITSFRYDYHCYGISIDLAVEIKSYVT